MTGFPNFWLPHCTLIAKQSLPFEGTNRITRVGRVAETIIDDYGHDDYMMICLPHPFSYFVVHALVFF